MVVMSITSQRRWLLTRRREVDFMRFTTFTC